MRWIWDLPAGAPYVFAAFLAAGAVTIAILAARRERDSVQTGIGTEILLPAMIICWMCSPLVASLVTPDWSPWTMGGSLLIMWAGFGFSAAYLWRWRKGERGARVVWRGFALGVIPPLLLASVAAWLVL